MNIFILTTDFPHTRTGGIAKVAYELSKQYVKLGHNVTAILRKRDEISPIKEIDGIKLEYVSCPFDFTFDYRVLSYGIYAFKKCLLYKRNIDVVHGFNFNSLGFIFYKEKLKRITKKPIKFITSQYETVKMDAIAKFMEFIEDRSISSLSQSILETFLIPLQTRYLKKSDYIITEDYNTFIAIKKMNIPSSRIFVIPSGVDIKKYNPNIDAFDIRMQYNLTSPLIVYIGRIAPRKGIQYLIKSLYRVKLVYPNVKC